MRVQGEIDLSTAPEVRAEVGRIARPGMQVVIDLTGVGFMDSTGLGSLVWARRRLRRIGGDILIVRPRPNVRRVLEISGVSEIVPVEGFPPPAA
jgi:stage II sporulation protein AA (anti-sigma F factor antagonist)